MDSVINHNSFPLLNAIDKNVFKSIKILTVFGCNGKEVIFVTNDDKVYCYGRNRFGGLGLGHLMAVETPQLNHYLSDNEVVNIFCGYEHWTALTASGRCFSWGHNEFGQLGLNSTDGTATPHLIEELVNETIVQMSCGTAHTLALTADGRVFSWGSNKFGQLGNGFKGNSALLPTPLPFAKKVKAISCGKNHCIALTVGGKLYVWGLNTYGQLGRQSISGNYTPFPKKLWEIASTVITKAICGPNYSLVLTSEGYVYCFGDNGVGQIGNGSTEKQVTPFRVSEDIKFKDIVANKEEDLSVAVSEEDTYYIWGLTQNRRYLVPKEIKDSSGLSMFDVYATYAKTKVTYKTIVITDELQEWERIRYVFESEEFIQKSKTVFNIMNSLKPSIDPLTTGLQTLDNAFDVKNLPILYTSLIDQRVRNSIRLVRVFGNRGCKVIFITNADKAYAYGLNRDGSLALDTDEERIRLPQLSPSLSGIELIDIESGFEHCIGLTAIGKCYSWGVNQFGQLGVGNCQNQRSAQLIQDLTDVTVIQIGCGAYHSMALTSDGDLFSWGHNTFAQLGDRTYNSRDIPTPVMISEKVTSFSCGLNHSAALGLSGRVYIWGNNTNGQLGREPEKDAIACKRLKPMSNRPTPIASMENIMIRKVVCGTNHTFLLSIDNDIYSFGRNNEGQIGNGSTVDQYIPQKLNKNIKIKDIIAYNDNELSIAVSDSNKCYIWGQVYGQKNFLKPQMIEDPPHRIDDIYVKNSSNKVMFRTFIVNTLSQIKKTGLNFSKLEELVFEEVFRKSSSGALNEKISDIIKNLDTNTDYDNSSEEEKKLDDILDVQLIPKLKSKLSDDNVRKGIKLLCVFGKSGSEVIYVTNEDFVYGFGDNESGCLGLGCDTRKFGSPTLNGTLSSKGLIDIRCGFKHCIGLTQSGQCYGWGYNKYGQLGFGNNRVATTPTLIVGLLKQKVIQICCGAYHSLALTSTGKIYSCGQNKLGQLGDCTYKDSWAPLPIATKHPIVSISCGWNHSTAIADIGIVYMWGHNQFGQLGREREHDYRPELKQWIANRPLLNHFFKNIQFKRAICGANYTLLLTTDGFVYAFGDNTNGQLGNGTTNGQNTPLRINDEIRFKDVITHYANDLSIGLSTDDRYFVWGLAFERNYLSPKLIPESGKESVFNVYAKYASNKITFKTVVVNENKTQINKSLTESQSNGTDQHFEDSYVYYSDESEEEEDINYFKSESTKQNTESVASTVCLDNISIHSSIKGSKSSNTLQNSVIQSFDNKNSSDLKILIEGKAIYCHKTILQIRNEKFWETLSGNMIKDGKEVRVYNQNYDPFYAFLQYLYGIEPEVNDKIIFELKSMADYYEETDLIYDCTRYMQNMAITPNLSNVCSLFERAVNEGLADLEKTCTEFAANNWKSIAKSDDFLRMNDSLSKRLLVTVLKNY